MMLKLLEIRDEGTCIAAFAISTRPSNPAQTHFLGREGFLSGGAVIMGYLCGERHSSADPYFWPNRTMAWAHEYVTEHFDELVDGDVIDVQFIKGLTTTKKQPEIVREDHG